MKRRESKAGILDTRLSGQKISFYSFHSDNLMKLSRETRAGKFDQVLPLNVALHNVVWDTWLTILTNFYLSTLNGCRCPVSGKLNGLKSTWRAAKWDWTRKAWTHVQATYFYRLGLKFLTLWEWLSSYQPEPNSSVNFSLWFCPPSSNSHQICIAGSHCIEQEFIICQ